MIQSQNQTIQIGSTNGANLKYICEVCGELFNSIDTLKQHLSVHTTNDKVVFNSKISSIMSLTKNKKISSSAISIPQSMTIFNLKDISSKLSSQSTQSTTTTSSNTTNTTTSTPTKVTSPPIINTNSNLINKINDTWPAKADTNNDNNSVVLKTVYQLEEPINFYELKNEQLIELTPSMLGQPNKQMAYLSASDSSVAKLDQFSSLPYHYAENENIYVCNLCNCTYDSLRSIKAHLWKHSGHRQLSYPINDHNRIAESTGKPIVTLKTDTNRKTIRSLQIPTSQRDSTTTTTPCDNGKSEQVRQSSGGICSALLEVIEKLRETESVQKETKRKRKSLTTQDNVVKEPKARKKRKTSQKVNQLIQIQDEINQNNIKQQEVIKNMLNNQETECRIETSVVNSLYEDDDNLLMLNKAAQSEPPMKQTSTFVCQLCFKHVKQDIHLHECSPNEQTTHTTPQDQCSIYLCHLCTSDQQIQGFCTHGENEDKPCFYRYFDELNMLKAHFESEHCDKKNNEQTGEMSAESPVSLPNEEDDTVHLMNKNITKKNSDMIKLLDLLANNDGTEQYACGLCLYVCYHLPSLKSHMWTHVTNEKFDYSVNTAIINAALDYENKISRSLALINNAIRFSKSFSSDDSKEESDSSSESDELNFSLDKKIADTLDMINFKEMEQKCTNNGANLPRLNANSIVAFRCSKCEFETVDLCILRLHKRIHLT